MHAGVVHDTSAVLTGTRWIGSSGGLIDGGGGAYDDLMLTWNIAAPPNSTYQYTYTLTSREGPPVNHIIFESHGCNNIGTDAATCISDPTVDAARALTVYENWTSLELANAIEGLNFVQFPKPSIRTIVISFASPGAPVWGDVYLAAGNRYVFNIGNLNHLDPNARTLSPFRATSSVPRPSPARCF